MKKNTFSLIITTFNEGPTFKKSVKSIVGELIKLEQSWEIIFVEDFSSDDTAKKVDELSKNILNSRVIFHTKNEGRGKSVKDGFRMATGDIVGYIDADLEISATYIPIFIKSIKDGNDLVVGKRYYEVSGIQSAIRSMLSKGYSLLVKALLPLPISDSEAGYKFFNRKKLISAIKQTRDNHWFWDTEICARAHGKGLKIDEIPVLFRKKADKKSTVKLLPDTLRYLVSLLKFRFFTQN